MQHSDDEGPTGGTGRGPGDGATDTGELDGPILTVAAVAARQIGRASCRERV